MGSENSIFRKSSLERVSSPEKLNECIKLASPSLMLILISVFTILVSGTIWIFSGHIPRYANITGISITGKNGGNGKIYSYVDIAAAKKLKTGMETRISPEYAPRAEYGYIKGKIIKIGGEIVTSDYLLKKFENPNILAPILPEKGNFIEIEIEPSDFSAFKMDEKEIVNGSICIISVVVASQKAYELIFTKQ
jgi:hypothetical protein